MSSLAVVPFQPGEECFVCRENFKNDDHTNGNPPMKHGDRGLLHDAGHKFCWREIIRYKNKCPFCKDSLNYSSLFSWTERVQAAPRNFIANASIVALTGIAMDAGIAAIGGLGILPAAQLLGETLAGAAVGAVAPPIVALYTAGQGLAGTAAVMMGIAHGGPEPLAFTCTCLPVSIGLLSGLIASKIPGADKPAILGGLASAVVLTGLGVSVIPASIVGGAISGGGAVWRCLSGYSL